MGKTDRYIEMTDEQLTEALAGATLGSDGQSVVYAEFQRRAAIASQKAAEDAAGAAKSAKWATTWTAVAAVASLLAAIVSVIGIFHHQ